MKSNTQRITFTFVVDRRGDFMVDDPQTTLRNRLQDMLIALTMAGDYELISAEASFEVMRPQTVKVTL